MTASLTVHYQLQLCLLHKKIVCNGACAPANAEFQNENDAIWGILTTLESCVSVTNNYNRLTEHFTAFKTELWRRRCC